MKYTNNNKINKVDFTEDLKMKKYLPSKLFKINRVKTLAT